MYGLVAGLRIARGKHIAHNMTCLIDGQLVNNEYVKYCENSEFIHSIWRVADGGDFRNEHKECDWFDPPGAK